MSARSASTVDPPALTVVARNAATHGEGPLAHIHEHPEIDEIDLDRIRLLLPGPGRILDVGAGRGGFVLRARSRHIDAYGLDIEPSAAAIWRRNGVPGVLANAFAPPFTPGSFDVIRLKEILEHVEDPRALVGAARALLRANGYIIAHVPSPYSQLYPVGNFWDDYTHVRPLSRLGLRRLFEDSGLAVVSIDGYTAGRNPIERLFGRMIALILPHTFRVVARRIG
jgi:SAM-dependent methyltransferase